MGVRFVDPGAEDGPEPVVTRKGVAAVLPEALAELDTDLASAGALRGDADKLRRIVINLVGNAIDALAEGGSAEPHIEVDITELPDEDLGGWSVEVEALLRSTREKVEELLPLKQLPPEIMSVAANVDDPGRLSDLVASNLRLRVEEAQQLLELSDPVRRQYGTEVTHGPVRLDHDVVQPDLDHVVQETGGDRSVLVLCRQEPAVSGHRRLAHRAPGGGGGKV